MAEVVAFAGPCLPRTPDRRWRELLDGVDLRPPARRGDVLTAMAEGPRALVVLDGLYYTVPAVTHKELLYALDAGVRVLGAASMGALRAAEMEPFGMEVVGWVFERYHRGDLVGDDEVAILHGAREHGYRPLTVALVEVRWALERLGSPPGSPKLVQRLVELPFSQRDPARVEALARESLGDEVAAVLMRRLGEGSVKGHDAEAALLRARESAVPPPTRNGGEVRVHTEYLSHFREWHLRAGSHEQAPAFREAWNVTQLLHPATPEFVDAVRRRFVLVSAAERVDAFPTEDRIDEIVEDLGPHARLPEPEIRQEARIEAWAELGTERFGDVEGAGRYLAGELHMGRRSGWPEIRELLSRQDDLIPPWAFVRAFGFTEALEPALAVARAAAPIQRAFRDWAEGARVKPKDLEGLAAELWSCSPDDVERQAADRALFRSHGFTPGLRDAVELVAAAERLAERPVNDYPQAKARLRATPLDPHPPLLTRLVGGLYPSEEFNGI